MKIKLFTQKMTKNTVIIILILIVILVGLITFNNVNNLEKRVKAKENLIYQYTLCSGQIDSIINTSINNPVTYQDINPSSFNKYNEDKKNELVNRNTQINTAYDAEQKCLETLLNSNDIQKIENEDLQIKIQNLIKRRQKNIQLLQSNYNKNVQLLDDLTAYINYLSNNDLNNAAQVMAKNLNTTPGELEEKIKSNPDQVDIDIANYADKINEAITSSLIETKNTTGDLIGALV